MNKEQLKQLIKEELQAVLNEDGHTDVASARRQLALAIEDSKQMLDALANLPGEGDLPSWWMKKVAISSAYLNGARDYLLTSTVAMNEMEIRSMDAGEQRRKCARLKQSHDRATTDAYTDPQGYGVIEMQYVERMAAKFDCDWLREL
jgi:hypothetical protein|tara:strand:+ start:34 stop:474 length:441 start_codon:yes stop_codon:yes gene_type:complete